MATTGITDDIVFAVSRLRVTFGHPRQADRTTMGTGFWVGAEGTQRFAFVTNRHVVDPKLLYEEEHDESTLSAVEIELRRSSTGDETRFFSVDLAVSPPVLATDGSDCAAFVDAKLDNVPDEFRLVGCYIKKDEIADAAWLAEAIDLMDFASFVGFAGSGNDEWWDHARSLPVARLASIASLTDREFKNAGIKTANVGTVSGLSFGG